MPREKVTPIEDELIPTLPMDLLQALRAAQDDAELGEFDEAEAVYAAMEFSKSLLSMAHELAGQAIQISSFQSEADRVAAAQRHVKLLGELFEQLQAVTMGARP